MDPSISISSSLNTINNNILDFVVSRGHGVKGLAELGLKTLPYQYIQPPQERFDLCINADARHESIPLIDMSKFDDDDDSKVAEAVCNAAQKWGFFQIVNHGVPLHVLEDVKDATHIFFGLSAEEKLKYSKQQSVTNNVRYGTSFTPAAENALEWKDYLSLLYVSDDEASSFWPSVCRNQALEFMRSSEIIVKKLLGVLMNGLNVKEIDETKESMLMGSKRINLNYYPVCPNPELTVGVGRHSDVSTLTVLLQDDIEGLYIRDTETMKWFSVAPVSGSLVINVGDALQIMSNGKYKSVEHRVSANGSHNRISVAIFVNPKASDIIGPFKEVLQSGEKPIYKHLLYSDYVKHFFRKAHDGKATIDFAKP